MTDDERYLDSLRIRLLTPEEIEAHMKSARRMRSEAAHGYLRRLLNWLCGCLRGAVSSRRPRDPGVKHDSRVDPSMDVCR